MEATVMLLIEVPNEDVLAVARDHVAEAMQQVPGAALLSWSAALEDEPEWRVTGVDVTTKEAFTRTVKATSSAEAEEKVEAETSDELVVAHVEEVAQPAPEEESSPSPPDPGPTPRPEEEEPASSPRSRLIDPALVVSPENTESTKEDDDASAGP